MGLIANIIDEMRAVYYVDYRQESRKWRPWNCLTNQRSAVKFLKKELPLPGGFRIVRRSHRGEEKTLCHIKIEMDRLSEIFINNK